MLACRCEFEGRRGFSNAAYEGVRGLVMRVSLTHTLGIHKNTKKLS